MYKLIIHRKFLWSYFTLVSTHNGQVIMTSENYVTFSNAKRAANKVAAAGKFKVEVERVGLW